MYKNLKTPAVGEWKLPRVQETFQAKQYGFQRQKIPRTTK